MGFRLFVLLGNRSGDVFYALGAARDGSPLGEPSCQRPVLLGPAPPPHRAPRPNPPVVCPGFGLDNFCLSTENIHANFKYTVWTTTVHEDLKRRSPNLTTATMQRPNLRWQSGGAAMVLLRYYICSAMVSCVCCVRTTSRTLVFGCVDVGRRGRAVISQIVIISCIFARRIDQNGCLRQVGSNQRNFVWWSARHPGCGMLGF